MSVNLNGNGMSDEGVGIAKDDTLTSDTPSAPGNNSAQNAEPGHVSHLQHDADRMAKRAGDREGNADGGIFTK